MLALADLLALVEVEDVRGAQQLAAAAQHRLAQLRHGDTIGHDDREVLVDGREGGHVLVGLVPRRGRRGESSQIDFEADGGIEVPSPADERVQLADPASDGVACAHMRGAPWVQERLLGRPEGEPDADLTTKRFQSPLEREEVSGLASTAPRGRGERANRYATNPVRLVRRSGLLAGKHPDRGPSSRLPVLWTGFCELGDVAR